MGNTVQIVARRSDDAVVFFPIHETDGGDNLADSTKLAIVALVVFFITVLLLTIYVCLTREWHESHSKGVDVTKDEPNQELKSREKLDAGRRYKMKKHYESNVSTGEFHHGMDHAAVSH